MSATPVIVTGLGGQALARISINRAATLIALDLAQSLTSAPHLADIHSPSVTVRVHEVIMVRSRAYRPWHGRTAHSPTSPHAILARDDYRCAYCGAHASTVDHILPASRGGGSTFGNLVAACLACNQRKADRTPAEAGMELLWAPYVHDPWAADQARVHELFRLDAGAE